MFKFDSRFGVDAGVSGEHVAAAESAANAVPSSTRELQEEEWKTELARVTHFRALHSSHTCTLPLSVHSWYKLIVFMHEVN